MTREDIKEARRYEEAEERILTLKISLEGPAELVSWIRENGPARICDRLSGLLPGDFRSHARTAQREQLLAMRSLLDAMIERLERGEERPRQATDLEVE